jgi:hypothetical protein
MHIDRRNVTSAAIHQHGCKFPNKHGCETKLTLQALSFSAALHFTKQLAFGVLAILGCIAVQCLILSFIFLLEAQIRYVLLQAQMLRRLYGHPSDSEQRPSADEEKSPKKTANVKGNSHLHILVEYH